jgi:glutamine amidotransferase
MNPDVTIIDYGASNLASLVNALDSLGISSEITGDPGTISDARQLILPGVGAFGPAMNRLNEKGLTEVIQEKAAAGTPLLGICLGMQLLFSVGLEDGEHQGLDLISGSVEKMTQVSKLPHMGWNTLELRPDPIWKGLPDTPYVYFVHSYACRPEREEDIIALTEYGTPFCSAVREGSSWGMQFHPEKSQKAGLRILENFCALSAFAEDHGLARGAPSPTT